MNVAPIIPEPTKRPYVRCSAEVHACQLTPRLQSWRKRHYGEDGFEKCTRYAAYVVDGAPLCSLHAGRVAIDFLVATTASTAAREG